MKKSIILLLLLLSIFNSFCQKYESLQKKAEESFNNYQYEQALEYANKALISVKKAKGNYSIEYAKILKDLGLYYYFNYDYNKSILSISEACNILKNKLGENNIDYILAYSDLGTIYYFNKEFRKANNIYKKTAALMKQIKGENTIDYAYEINKLGQTQHDLGQFDKAEVNFKICKKIFESLEKKDEEYSMLLNNMAGLYQDKGFYSKADEYYTKSIKIHKKTNGEKNYDYATSVQNLGSLYLDMGRYEDALGNFEKALEIYIEIVGNESPEAASTYNYIASAALHTGNYPKSEEYYLFAKQIYTKTVGTDNPSYLKNINNLAVLYSNLNRLDEAEQLYDTILTHTHIMNEDPLQYIYYRQNRASIYSAKFQFEKAKTSYESILRQYRLIAKNQEFYSIPILGNLAYINQMLNNAEKAEEEYKHCLEILEKLELTRSNDYIINLYNLGMLYMDNKEYEKAENYLLEAEKLAKKYMGENNFNYLKYPVNLAFLYEKQKNYKKAGQYYYKAMNLYEKIIYNNFMYMSASEKEKFMGLVKIHFAFFYNFMLNESKNNPAIIKRMYRLKIIEKSMILNSIRNIIKRIYEKKDPVLIAKFKNYKANKEYLNKLYTLSQENTSKFEIDSLEKTVNRLEKELSKTVGISVFQSDNEVPYWEQVSNKLQQNEAAVEIIRVPNYGSDKKKFEVNYAAIIIKPEQNVPDIVYLNYGRKLDSNYVNYYFKSIFNKTDDTVSYFNFWQPIAKKLTGIKRVYLSRDGIYNIININTLKNTKTNQFVINECDIHLVLNTLDVVLIKNKEKNQQIKHEKSIILFGYPNYYLDVTNNIKETDKNLLTLAINSTKRTFSRQFLYINDLPGTKKEVETINDILKQSQWKTELYIADNANENVLKQLNNPTILHLATHGFYDFKTETDKTLRYNISRTQRNTAIKEPLHRSGILLAGSGFMLKLVNGNIRQLRNLEDGVVSAYEASNLNLQKTDLVVLSACLSSVGRLSLNSTEGYTGMLRGFLMAGVNTVMASNWAVDDFATQELMIRFYNNLIHNYNKYEDFRNAQLELMTKYPEPYYWGAFIMVGD